MQEMMLAFSESELADADVLLYVTDVIEKPRKRTWNSWEKVKKNADSCTLAYQQD